MRESRYQADVIKALRDEFPGCVILKNDANYIQGIPDLTILYGPRWAMLEVKTSEEEAFRPNQEYYIDHLNGMGFAAVIFPGNEGAVFRALQHALSADG